MGRKNKVKQSPAGKKVSPTPHSTTHNQFKKRWVLLGLVLVGGLLYGRPLFSEFILDAQCVIVNNPVIKQPALFSRIFTEEFFSACHPRDSFQTTPAHSPAADSVSSSVNEPRRVNFEFNYYRPLTLASFALDYRLWQLNPFGYKLENLLLHILNAFLVFCLLLTLFGRFDRAMLAAGLFLILPVHEWVVNYEVGRGDLLQAFFQLASLLVFAQVLVQGAISASVGQRNDFKKMLLSVLLFICALLSRENALLQPLLIFIVAVFLTRDVKRSGLLSLPFVLVGLGYFLWRMQFLPIDPHAGLTPGNGAFSNILETLRTVVAFFLRFIFPWVVQVNLLGDFSQGIAKLLLSSVGLICFGVFVVKKWQAGEREWALGLVWILINFLPFAKLVPQFKYLGPVLSEHYLYLASVGFVILLSGFLVPLKLTWQKVLVGILILYYAGIVLFNNSFWTTEERLLRRVSSLSGGEYHVDLERLLMKYNIDLDKIKELVSRSMYSQEKNKWYTRMGQIELQRQRLPEAIESFEQALKYDPNNVDDLMGLALAHFVQGKREEAVEYLKQALTINPELDEPNRFMGILYYKDREIDQSAPYLEKAYFLNPDNLDGILYWSMVNFIRGDRPEAERLFNRAMRQAKGDSFPCRFLAVELYDHKFLNESLALLERNKKNYDDDPEFLLLLGKMYFNAGKAPEAFATCQEVLQLDPNNAQAKGCVAAIDVKKKY